MFYTVRMKRRQIVSSFDNQGNKVSDKEVLLDETYHDLPYQTALSYQKRFPDAQVQIERQFGGLSGKGPRVSEVEYAGKKGGKKYDKPKPKPKPRSAGDQASTYGAVVNKMMEDAA